MWNLHVTMKLICCFFSLNLELGSHSISKQKISTSELLLSSSVILYATVDLNPSNSETSSVVPNTLLYCYNRYCLT